MTHPLDLARSRKAAQEGSQAYHDGRSRSSCPHALPHLRGAWILGFDRARNRQFFDLIGGCK